MIAEQLGAIFDRHLPHAVESHRLFHHVADGVRRHVRFQIAGQHKTREVVEHFDRVIPTPAHHEEVTGVGLPELIGRGGLHLKLVGGREPDQRDAAIESMPVPRQNFAPSRNERLAKRVRSDIAIRFSPGSARSGRVPRRRANCSRTVRKIDHNHVTMDVFSLEREAQTELNLTFREIGGEGQRRAGTHGYSISCSGRDSVHIEGRITGPTTLGYDARW